MCNHSFYASDNNCLYIFMKAILHNMYVPFAWFWSVAVPPGGWFGRGEEGERGRGRGRGRGGSGRDGSRVGGEKLVLEWSDPMPGVKIRNGTCNYNWREGFKTGVKQLPMKEKEYSSVLLCAWLLQYVRVYMDEGCSNKHKQVYRAWPLNGPTYVRTWFSCMYNTEIRSSIQTTSWVCFGCQ